MKKAKYYIYRNLTQDCFSVRYKGVVICRVKNLIASGVTFQVSELGRQRVLRENKKYVHAYVVCDSYKIVGSMLADLSENFIDKEVKYNPYQQGTFTFHGEPIYKADTVYLTRNKVFV